MPNHVCETCLKDFDQAAKLQRHKNNKNKCKPSSTVQALLQANPLPPPVTVELVGPFREASLKMNEAISKKERQDNGIFFTPKKARQLAFQKLKEFGLVNPQTILEPSCGTGEFLEDIAAEYPQASMVGVEKDPRVFKTLKPLNNLQTLNEDFLLYKGTQVDLVIGNPPFFVTKDKNINCMTGRPNIYVQFLYKSLTDHLKPNGFLAFILPTSFFNCTYYEPMRNYISHYCSIKFIQELDVSYHETSQDTMLMIIQNSPDPNMPYFFKRNGCNFISPYYKELNELVKDTNTLNNLGFTVKTGDVVWNQEKDKLCDSPDDETTVIIYSSNIKNGSLVFDNISGTSPKDKDGKYKPIHVPLLTATEFLKDLNLLCKITESEYIYENSNLQFKKIDNEKDRKKFEAKLKHVKNLVTKVDYQQKGVIWPGIHEKKQYIKDFECDPVEGPAIVVNRGYGNVYDLNYAEVTLPKFYAENHVNMILPKNEAAKAKIPDVLKSLGSDKTKKFIDWFVGKGAMSKTEVECVLPIFS